MAKKSSSKIKASQNSVAADIEVGENIGGNLIVGNNNMINITPEQFRLRSLHQLPPAPADFTGREAIIADILKDFDGHKGATISGLTGMGGIGKTALGLAVAHQIADKYPDAQIFLDLKGTTTPLSATDILRHVILSFEPTADLRILDETNLQGAYQSVLHGKKVLLFLDNARSAEQTAPLRLPETCALLVTSRWIFPLAGLKSHKVGVLKESEAIDFLFGLCLRINDKAADLAKACAYLPLALRIAGSFLQVNEDWPIEKYLTQLNDRKKRLEILKQSHEEAELQSDPDLLATFELSYAQLSESNQKCWRVLGVFSTSFDIGAAQAMWELEEGETMKLLGLLKRYSLLDFDGTSVRYRLHDLLVDYVRTKMGDKEEQAAHIKHASHYLEVMKTTAELYNGGGEKVLQGLRLLDVEFEHIRVAQLWIAENIEKSEQIIELAMLYPNASAHCLDLRLASRQKIIWLDVAVNASKKLSRMDMESIHLGNLGSAYIALGDTYKGIELYEQALITARKIGNRRSEGDWLGNLGIAYAALGDVRKAIEFHEQALVIDREIGDRHGEGVDLRNLGNNYADLGDLQNAIKFYEQGLAIALEIGDRRGEGNALGNLGSIYATSGNVRKAIELYEKRLVIAREIGDRRGEESVLGNLGVINKNMGNVQKAIEFYEQSIEIAREIGDQHGEGTALGNLGNAYKDLGDIAKAIEFYEQQLVIVREIGDRRGEGNALFNMGLVLYGLVEKEKAIDLVKQALKVCEAIESPNAEKARNKL